MLVFEEKQERGFVLLLIYKISRSKYMPDIQNAFLIKLIWQEYTNYLDATHNSAKCPLRVDYKHQAIWDEPKRINLSPSL